MKGSKHLYSPACTAILVFAGFHAQPLCSQSLDVTSGGGGYSHTLPIQVCAAQRGRDFEAPGLERGIHFRGVF